jgi:hypothetical protein
MTCRTNYLWTILLCQNYKHALHFALHMYRHFRSRWVWTFTFRHPCTAHAFFIEPLSNNIQGLYRNVAEMCTTFGAHSLSDLLRNCIRPDTRLQINNTNSVAFSPQANYTNWATVTCRRNLVPTFVDRGVSRGQRGGSPTVVNLSFIYRSRYFSFK